MYSSFLNIIMHYIFYIIVIYYVPSNVFHR